MGEMGKKANSKKGGVSRGKIVAFLGSLGLICLVLYVHTHMRIINHDSGWCLCECECECVSV